MLLISKTAIAALSLTQPSSEVSGAQVNLTLSSNNGKPSPVPQRPFKLQNFFVHPPVAVEFTGYGDPIPRSAANACVHEALNHALSTRDHKPLARIDASDLVYRRANAQLDFYPQGVVIWEEWKNALYLVLEFVQKFETRDFRFEVEVLGVEGWYAVGKGFLVTFCEYC